MFNSRPAMLWVSRFSIAAANTQILECACFNCFLSLCLSFLPGLLSGLALGSSLKSKLRLVL